MNKSLRDCVALFGVLAAVAGLALFYLTQNHSVLFLGDGYIYLAYARNIALGKGWSINPGEVSFATTSPLWTVFLSTLYKLFPQHDLFPFFSAVAGLVLFLIFLTVFWNLLRRLDADTKTRMIVFAVFALTPFNGLFYSISAMETGIYLLLFFVFLSLIFPERRAGTGEAILGFLAGLVFLTRPEGIALTAAYCLVYSMNGDRLPAKILRMSKFLAVFILTVLPWEIFIRSHSGYWLPTSGTGRLYLALPSILPNVAPKEYIHASPVQKLSFLPAILDTQFIHHPLVLLFCIAPFLFMLFVLAASHKVLGSKSGLLRGLVFMAVYASLNIFMYLYFEPQILQRYLIAFFPCSVVFLVVRFRRLDKLPIPLFAAGALLLIAVNAAAYPYYRASMLNNSRVVDVMRGADHEGRPGGVLAAEPLGFAAYFTHFRIVDLSGLINPDLWKALEKGADADTLMEYAAGKNADYIYFSSPPAGREERFSALFPRRMNGGAGVYHLNKKAGE